MYKFKSVLFILLIAALASCNNYRKLLTDEVVLKDGNSQTGTIIKCDSTSLRLKKIDESISIIPWNTVDTIQGKKLRTLFYGINMGYYNTPYFSVFRNERLSPKSFGMEFKAGMALRGQRLYYGQFSIIPAKPYSITKLGIGYQRYVGAGYIHKNCFFWGSELNLLNAQYNNGPQITLEPFTGFEKKCNEYIRLHFKFGVQINMANKNNQLGANATIGVHFMKRNFKRYYTKLNAEHRLPRK